MKPLLPRPGPPPDFDDPVGVLREAHRAIRAELDTLERIVAALGRDEPEAPEALRACLDRLQAEMLRHTLDEDVSLFPRLGELRAVAELAVEHRVIEAIFLALRDAAEHRAGVADHVPALVGAYREHLAREEADVLAAASRLDAATLRAIGLEMRIRRS